MMAFDDRVRRLEASVPGVPDTTSALLHELFAGLPIEVLRGLRDILRVDDLPALRIAAQGLYGRDPRSREVLAGMLV